MYDDRATLVTRLTEIRAAITKARTAQSYGAGESTVTRALLKSLLDEEQYVLGQIDKIDARSTSSGSTGASANKIQFNRPS